MTPTATAASPPKNAPSKSSHKRQEPLCIRGKVTNWGYKDEALVTVSFTRPDGSVLETLSNVLGEYEFYAVRDQVGAINIVNSWPGHQMLTDDIVVRSNCEDEVYVWLGFYSGPDYPKMPVSVTMSLAPENPKPGDQVTFRVEILNGMEVPITQVWLTDYLGQELAFLGAGGAGQAEYADGLVTIKLDRLEPGVSTWVTIDAQLGSNPSSPEGSFVNRASVLYRESVAVQAAVEINLAGEGQPTTPAPVAAEGGSEEHLPVTGVVLSPGGAVRLLGLGFLLLLVLAGWRRTRRK